MQKALSCWKEIAAHIGKDEGVEAIARAARRKALGGQAEDVLANGFDRPVGPPEPLEVVV